MALYLNNMKISYLLIIEEIFDCNLREEKTWTFMLARHQ